MRVPLQALLGPARATLSFPGVKDFEVIPTTIELTIEPQSWQALLLDIAPWTCGAVVLALMAWLAMRRRRAKTA